MGCLPTNEFLNKIPLQFKGRYWEMLLYLWISAENSLRDKVDESANGLDNTSNNIIAKNHNINFFIGFNVKLPHPYQRIMRDYKNAVTVST